MWNVTIEEHNIQGQILRLVVLGVSKLIRIAKYERLSQANDMLVTIAQIRIPLVCTYEYLHPVQILLLFCIILLLVKVLIQNRVSPIRCEMVLIVNVQALVVGSVLLTNHHEFEWQLPGIVRAQFFEIN